MFLYTFNSCFPSMPNKWGGKMAYSFSFNSSVCNEIANRSVAFCMSRIEQCENVGEHSGIYLTAFQTALFSIGGVLVIKSIAHGVVVIKLLAGDRSDNPRIQDYQSLRSEASFCDAIEEPQRYSNHRESILRHLCASVDYVAKASLPIIAGFVATGLSKISCWSEEDCINSQSYVANGCVLAMKFFVQSIDNAIGE